MKSNSPAYGIILAVIVCLFASISAIIFYINTPRSVRLENLEVLINSIKNRDESSKIAAIKISENFNRPLEGVISKNFAADEWNAFIIRLKKNIQLIELIDQDKYYDPQIEPLAVLLNEQQQKTLFLKLDEIRSLLSKINQKRELIKENQFQIEKLKSKKFLLLNDLRILLSLPSITENEIIKEDITKGFYTKGIFKNLPILQELITKDEMLDHSPSSSEELRDKMLSLDLKLPTIAAAQFSNTLNQLTESGNQLVAEVEKALKNEKELSSELRSLNKKLSSSKSELRKRLVDYLELFVKAKSPYAM